MNEIYKTPKDAIANLANLDKRSIKRLKVSGVENDGIFLCKDRIFKITSSKREFLAAKRIMQEDFQNVVKIHNIYECLMIFSEKPYRTYILEEERLFRDKRNYVFDDLDIAFACVDINKRLPYFVAVLNGLAELASIGVEHNDLHSLNIMMDKIGEIKIIDFGFAKLKKTCQIVNVRAKTLYI